MGIFKRTSDGTQAPGAQTQIDQTPASYGEADQGPVSAAVPAQQPGAERQIERQTNQTLVRVAPQGNPSTLPAGLAEQIAEQLAMAGFDPNSPCGLMDQGGVQESLGSSLPIVRIEYAQTQKSIQAGLKRGLLTNLGTLEQVERMRLVLFTVKLQRVLFPEKYDSANPAVQPLCMSLDGKHASHGEDCDARNHGLMPGLACAGCNYSKWSNEGGKRTPPRCAEVYTPLLFDRDAQVPIVFPIKRTGVKPFKALYAGIQLKGMRWGVGLPNATKHLSVGFTLKPQQVKNYYVPEFGAFEQIPADEIEQYSAMLLGLLPMFSEVDTSKAGAEDEQIEREAEGGGGRGGNHGGGSYADESTSFAPDAYDAPEAEDQTQNSGGRKF